MGRKCPQKGVGKKKKGREIDGKKKKKTKREEGRKGGKCRGKWGKEESSVASKSRQVDEHGSSGASAQLGEGTTAQHLPPPSSTFLNLRGRLEMEYS